MKFMDVQDGKLMLQLSINELLMIHNALNEVCNGIEVPEFHARIGATPEQVGFLLSSVSAALDEATAVDNQSGDPGLVANRSGR